MPNIDARGRALRLLSGVVFLIVGAVLLAVLEGNGRLLLFIPLFFGFLGLLQAAAST